MCVCVVKWVGSASMVIYVCRIAAGINVLFEYANFGWFDVLCGIVVMILRRGLFGFFRFNIHCILFIVCLIYTSFNCDPK